MLASFVDGSKTMIEMTALSNGINLPLDKVGMNGPISEVKIYIKTLIPEKDGGVIVILEGLILHSVPHQEFFLLCKVTVQPLLKKWSISQWEKGHTTRFTDHII